MAALGCALAAGCTLSSITSGRPIALGAIDLVPRGTRKAQVLERLGPPDAIALIPQGSVFEYAYREDGGSAIDLSFFRASFQYDEARARADRLVIEFDAAGVVRHAAMSRQTEAH